MRCADMYYFSAPPDQMNWRNGQLVEGAPRCLPCNVTIPGMLYIGHHIVHQSTEYSSVSLRLQYDCQVISVMSNRTLFNPTILGCPVTEVCVLQTSLSVPPQPLFVRHVLCAKHLLLVPAQNDNWIVKPIAT